MRIKTVIMTCALVLLTTVVAFAEPADDEPVEQRQSDKKVHQLEQEGYVEADHAENPPAGTQRDSACASAAINAVPGNC